MNVETLWVSTWEKDNSFGNSLDWVKGVTVRRSTDFAKCHAGRRTDLRDKNRELFSGELFSGELFSGAALLPENFVPINVCGVDSFSPN